VVTYRHPQFTVMAIVLLLGLAVVGCAWLYAAAKGMGVPLP
jgi:hypothetical protein